MSQFQGVTNHKEAVPVSHSSSIIDRRPVSVMFRISSCIQRRCCPAAVIRAQFPCTTTTAALPLSSALGGGWWQSFSTASAPSNSPLDAFRDPVPRQTRMSEPVGRSWSVKELRRKSFDDLHKLWYVLYKERNMLLTEQQLSRRRGIIFPQPERMHKVRKSMGAIRQVLGERKREKIAAFQSERQSASEQKNTDPLQHPETEK